MWVNTRNADSSLDHLLVQVQKILVALSSGLRNLVQDDFGYDFCYKWAAQAFYFFGFFYFFFFGIFSFLISKICP